MKKFLIIFCLIIASLMVLGLAFLGLGWWVLQPNIYQTSAPVTREAALKNLESKVLPASAHKIQYYLMNGNVTPGFTVCVRFEAPVADCQSLALKVSGTTPLTAVSHPKRPDNSEMPAWFDPNNIFKGVTGGKGYEESPQIWIDEERGIFYYYLTD